MARKQKENDEFDDASDVNEFDDLDDVAVKTVIGRVGGIRKSFPLKLAEVLKAKFDSDGSFAVPKDWLEEKLGMDLNKSIKGRSYQLKKKLNKQYGDMVGDGKIWHVGNIKDESYTFAVIDATSEDETGWKNPPPRKTKKSDEGE